MRLSNMLKICLVFWKSEPQFAYKHYAYKKHVFIVKREGQRKKVSEYYYSSTERKGCLFDIPIFRFGTYFRSAYLRRGL